MNSRHARQQAHTQAARERFSDDVSAKRWSDMYESETMSLSDSNFRIRRDKTVALVHEVLPDNGIVLDVGCGAAPVVAPLRNAGITCFGLEFSPDMLAHALQRMAALDMDDSGLMRGDCCALPIADSSIDIVVCLGVISYVEDYSLVFSEIRRVLKPNGIAIISFRNQHCKLFFDPVRLAVHIARRVMRKPPTQGYTIGQFLDFREVNEKMLTTGFIQLDQIGIGFGPLCLRGKPLLPDRWSITISRGLTRLFELIRFRAAFRWAADVSLWIYRKA